MRHCILSLLMCAIFADDFADILNDGLHNVFAFFLLRVDHTVD